MGILLHSSLKVAPRVLAKVKRTVPAKMVIYPRSGQLPGGPKFIRDMWERELDWFDQYRRWYSLQAFNWLDPYSLAMSM